MQELRTWLRILGMRNKIKFLFTPQEENNYRAKILSPSYLALFVFIFLFSQTLINFFALVRPGVLGYSSTITPEKIIELTNQERAGNGLSVLKLNGLLSQAAQEKAEDMFNFDYWAHKSPAGKEPWVFLREAGYSYQVAGENLARDFSDPGSVVNAWMRSPTHRENILNYKFKEVGVAVVDGALGGIQTTLVVQFFGAPKLVASAEAPKTEEKPALIPREEVYETAPVLAQGEERLISPLVLTKALSALLFGVITSALIVDSYLVFKKQIHRSAGRTTAHAGFLAIIFFLILFSGGPGLIN